MRTESECRRSLEWNYRGNERKPTKFRTRRETMACPEGRPRVARLLPSRRDAGLGFVYLARSWQVAA